MAKFFLRTQKQEGTATLYITIQKRVPKVSLRFVSTGIEVDIQTWNRVNRNIQSWSRYTATKEGEELQRKMSLVIQTVDSLFNEGLIGGNEDKDVIEYALMDISTVEAHLIGSTDTFFRFCIRWKRSDTCRMNPDAALMMAA